MDLKELSPEAFTFELYEPNYYDRLEMWDVVKWDGRALERRLEETAVGWCDAFRLGVRPRGGLAAVMCEDSDVDRFWFYVSPKTIGVDLPESGTKGKDA